jgi:cardiolipin synthase
MSIALAVGIVGYLLAAVSLVHLLTLRKQPASTLSWSWAILLFPYLGTIAYWTFGGDRLRRKRIRRRAGFIHFNEDRRDSRAQKSLAAVPADDVVLARTMARLNRIPPTSVESMRLIETATELYADLVSRIDAAKHHVHVQVFIWRDDEAGNRVFDALISAAKRGVQVRMLIDEMGSVKLRAKYFDPLIAVGGEFSWFLSLNPMKNRYLINLRNHRKLQIIDGEIAFVGGMNIGVEYEGLDPKVGPWRDLQAEFLGPIVSTLQECFADDWYFATGKKLDALVYYPETSPKKSYPALVLAGGPDDPGEPMLKSIMGILDHATKRAWLTTGYFVPNAPLMAALQLCAARGVDVRLLISEKTDNRGLLRMSRSYYPELLSAGVRLFEFSEALNHTKAGVIDADWVLIGSTNLDNRSMRVNFELSVLVHHAEVANQLAEILEDDFSKCVEVTPQIVANRPWRERALECALRPFSPLF